MATTAKGLAPAYSHSGCARWVAGEQEETRWLCWAKACTKLRVWTWLLKELEGIGAGEWRSIEKGALPLAHPCLP